MRRNRSVICIVVETDESGVVSPVCVEAVAGPRSADGTQLYPGGIPEGSEPFWWLWLTGNAQGAGRLVPAFNTDFGRYMAFATDPGPEWTPLDFDFAKATEHVTGEVTLKLYKGNIVVDKRQSPHSLYDEGIATMEGGGSYNQTDAEGFLRIQGLPSRVQGRINPRSI